ncbi:MULTISPECIES: bifunctional adenosylcobinamide kinase/adenosylcobinamide-phosphate guanylyltransferase [Franconibacter]|uniref:bifunctional adenosylcobinamide kinase/adenosylcobinamide-phosphate guanylyltransferase n=1 Tax=Franconibacter TaxID=1649295 RepID=UPI0016636844|nr:MULTISPECIES: bifunctional adenosylcobinamide kinase/adenosylcobinamide-phosphate guanylyltransferase [Franconibacter]MCK1968906.1 bifunctional adenosylcobinamide kinase/adenosylcobinamide-phosphate guanylyltransferase [Franconibacter sp. IITDAS19]MEB5921989.1 bifunctional adenosylcobinamide kinase/adenosylcobinamide-phosphate guanylyltransferase [Franconibacter daqui]GGD23441.1 adenosylcobinamide kinase/adenosylcobinamide phosphate guanyltransferase [Franconibacter daqui]
MMKLITGGARSGKSRHAETLAAQAGERVLYIATSQVMDEEMAARVRHHQQSRPAHWRTLEAWRELDRVITPRNDPQEVVLLECITTLISNVLFAFVGDTAEETWDYAAIEAEIEREITALIHACERCPAPVILVTNEVGMGIVPENRLARHFRDIAGRVNQRLAQAAHEVWLVVSGIGVKIK